MSTISTVTFPQVVELKYPKKARNEDIIRIDTQEKIFRIERKPRSLSSRITLTDPNGTVIYEMRDLLSWRNLNGIFKDTNSKQKLFTFQKKSTLSDSKRNILIWNGEREGEAVMRVEGNYKKKDYRVITLPTEQVIASVSCTPLTIEPFQLDDDKEFVVSIQPGQDAGLLLLAVIAFEQQYYEAQCHYYGAASGAGVY